MPVEAPLPRAWRDLVAEINGHREFGQRGVRDPDAPCVEFDPLPNIDWLGIRIVASGYSDCRSDGHYLCGGCRHLSQEAIEWRMDGYAYHPDNA